MERMTVDFGIDLGTTNSSIAVFNGTAVTVFKNNLGQEYTPSVVRINNKGNLIVGHTAKQQLGFDDENTFAEFKLQMGTPNIYHFASSGRQMRPEELSSEVLKELKNDVQRRTAEDVHAAVISVPAAFEMPQCDATNKAARLAGLSLSPLVQEPVAAALAYGFQSNSDKVFWMVYDFGGGTFDVAIITVREGQIQVVNHAGDNHLGGKSIDWDIVNQILVPALTRENKLTDFTQGNGKWKSAFAKLKLKAEEAKITLSNEKAADIEIDILCNDDRGLPVRFEYELKRRDIEPLVEHYVERTVNKCKEVLADKRLSTDDIEKLILVGGPTHTPILRDILKTRLNISLESNVDPLTVVAQGAAIFAATQTIPHDLAIHRPLSTGEYNLELDYEPVGRETMPEIAGRVASFDGKTMSGFTIEFIQQKTLWRSGKITLTADGKFMTAIRADEPSNTFRVELCDVTGRLQAIIPDHFMYTHGMTISHQPLINTLGVALADGTVQAFLRKGRTLPARQREIHRTTVALKKGESGLLLRIPLVEGEIMEHDDRNALIGEIRIDGNDVSRDVPLGSEVEITVDVNESRIPTIKAYIPILDEEFTDICRLSANIQPYEKMAEEFEHEQARLQKMLANATETGDKTANECIEKINSEGMVHDIQSSLDMATHDVDAAQRCQKRLADLKIMIDKAEDAMKWALLVNEANQEIVGTREVVEKWGTEEEKQQNRGLEAEVTTAINGGDAAILRQKIERLESLRNKILVGLPGWWVGFFEHLKERSIYMLDQVHAEKLITQGHRAMNNNDIEELKSVVRQLISLLPQNEQNEARGYGGTTLPK